MRNIGKILVALLAALSLVLSISACGSNNNSTGNFSGGVDQSYQPTAYGPTINGQAYCAWVVDPSECVNSNIPQDHWRQMPSTQPSNYRENDTSDIISQMFLWHMMYSMWYGSPSYYNSYIPAGRYGGYSGYQSTVVNNFNNTYKSKISTVQSRGQWKDNTGRSVPVKNVTPDKIAPPRAASGSTGYKPGSSNMSRPSAPRPPAAPSKSRR